MRGQGVPEGFTGEHPHRSDAGQRRDHRGGAGGQHNGPGRQHRLGAIGGGDRHLPGADQAGVAQAHIHPQGGVTIDAVVGRDGRHLLPHPLQHATQIHPGLQGAEAVAVGMAQARGEAGRADQGLAGHTAGVQAVAAHAMPLHQGHLGPNGGGDVGGDQASRTGANDDQVAIEMAGAAPGAIELPKPPAAKQQLHDPGQQAQQGEGTEQGRREEARQAGELGQLGAGVHVHQGGRQHAQLGDKSERHQGHGREPHQQVHQKERNHRHQPQTQQIGGSVASDARLDRPQTLAEAAPHRFTQQRAGQQAGRRGSQGGAERHEQRALQQAEDGAARQGEHGGTGKGEGRHQHVHQQVPRGGGQRGRLAPGQELGAGGLQGSEIQLAIPALAEEEDQSSQQQADRQETPHGCARGVLLSWGAHAWLPWVWTGGGR